MAKQVDLRRPMTIDVRDRRPVEYWEQKQYEVPSVGEVLVVNENQPYWSSHKTYATGKDSVFDRLPKKFVCKVTDVSSRYFLLVDEVTPSGRIVSKSYLRKDFIYGFLRYVVVEDSMLSGQHTYPMLDFNSEIVKKATLREQRLVKIVNLK